MLIGILNGVQECPIIVYQPIVDCEQPHGLIRVLDDAIYIVKHRGDNSLSGHHRTQMIEDELRPRNVCLLLHQGQCDHLLDIQGNYGIGLDPGLEYLDPTFKWIPQP